MTQLLKDIFQKDSVLKGLNIVLLWDDVIDEKIKALQDFDRTTRDSKALKLQRGVLYVITENSVWAQELNFFRKDIIDKINNKAGYKAVRDIRFKVGGMKE